MPMLKHYWWASQRVSNCALYQENLWEICSYVCWPWCTSGV